MTNENKGRQWLRLCLSIMVLLTGLTVSSIAQADYCKVVGGTRTATFGPLTVQRDVPVGTFLAESIMPSSQVLDCSAAMGVVNGQKIGIKSYGTYNSMQGGYRVYNTSIPGIGYALAVDLAKSCNAWWGIESANDYRLPCGISGIFNGGTVYQGYKILLYKTGPAASGMLASQRVGAGITSIAGVWDTEVPININGVKVTSLACSLNSTSINVPLGDISASKFTAPGLTLGDKGFDIGLTCDKDAKINVALAGTQNTETTETSVLALTNAGQTGSASGVGVQLLYGGTPLKINNNILLKTTPGGQETLPFTARYYQTKSLVMPGKANSSATLNITYQ